MREAIKKHFYLVQSSKLVEPPTPLDLGLEALSILKIWDFYREFAENL